MDETLRCWGQNIRMFRKALGLTRDQLANTIGVNGSTVTRWEQGLTEPRRAHKAKLAEALSTDIRILFPMTRAA